MNDRQSPITNARAGDPRVARGDRAANLLLIAARAPLPGFTKTRLGAAIGMDRAATLYCAFLADLAGRFMPSSTYDLAWAFTPPEYDFRAMLTALVHITGEERVRYVAQSGSDWAERQTNLLCWGSAQGYARTVLIASDSPHLASSIPLSAFAALAEHDVALGRVADGGYYLIGVRGFHDVVTGVRMSAGDTAGVLVARASALGLRVAELPATFDVDTAADVALLVDALAPRGDAAPATWAALRDLGLVAPPSPQTIDPATALGRGERVGRVGPTSQGDATADTDLAVRQRQDMRA